MDLDEFQAVLRTTGLDLWALIETAISVAARDDGKELRARRDGIVEQLYATAAAPRCRNCDGEEGPAQPRAADTATDRIRSKGAEEEVDHLAGRESRKGDSPSTPQSPYREEEAEEEEEEDDRDQRRHGRPFEDELSKILAIKEHLDDPDQSDDSLVHMLQSLADMDLTFTVLKETDIGRHVNSLRKHPSSEIRRLVKHLVRKWKDLVDEWVKSNSHEAATSAIITDGDSPQQIQPKNSQNGNQVPDFGYSPNPHSSSSDKANWEAEPKAKAGLPPRKEAPAKPNHPAPPPPAPAAKAKDPAREQKDSLLDPERLASARRRLHENYQEAQNAKKQRTIQVMDIHDIPKPKSSFSARNKGGFQARHW